MSKTSYEDRSIWRHAGLPFFFRHTPPLALRRGAFWLSFALVAVVTAVDILLMPYPRGSMAASLRAVFFDRAAFRDFEEGLRAIFDQYFVGALILSGIVAPLYATYSLAMERVGGTIEFLRLSPMSTLSVVLGKMFAPAHLLHLFSAGLLALGAVFGVAAGHAPDDVGLALLSIVAASLTMHALGGLLACATTTFRGFGAVIGLVGLGLALYVLPGAAGRAPGVGFLQYLSPFSAMNALFWTKGMYSTWYGVARIPDQFMGFSGLVAPFVLCYHGLLFTVMVWAATRWLDHPEGTALPKMAWVFLLLSVLLLALGLVPNTDGGLSAQFIRVAPGAVPPGLANGQPAGYFTPSVLWHVAMVIFLVLGLVLALLVGLDHPHRRDLALEEACERLGNRTQGPLRTRRRLTHALFVSSFAAIVIALGFGFFMRFSPMIKAYSATTVVSGAALVFVFFFFASLAAECSWIRFHYSGGRVAAASVAVSLLLASVIVPMVNATQTAQNWTSAKEVRNRCWLAETKVLALEPQIAALETLPPDQVIAQAAAATPGNPPGVITTRQLGPNGAVTFVTSPAYPQALTAGQQLAQLKGELRNQKNFHERQLNYLATHPDLALYAEDMTSREVLQDLDAKLADAPLAVIWRYHRSRIFWYPLGLLAACALIVFFRSWTYRAIEQEARKAMASAGAAVGTPAAAPAPAAPGGDGVLPAANA